MSAETKIYKTAIDDSMLEWVSEEQHFILSDILIDEMKERIKKKVAALGDDDFLEYYAQHLQIDIDDSEEGGEE